METALEQVLIQFYKKEMLSFMQVHPEHFPEAVELALSDKQPYAWRSAFLLGDCMEENDTRIQAYTKKIISVLPGKETGHQRELLKILIKMELDDEDEGFLFDFCVTLWEQIDRVPSVRYIAFKFISRIAKKHPDLLNEVILLTQDRYMDTLSPGIRRAISEMIKEITNK